MRIIISITENGVILAEINEGSLIYDPYKKYAFNSLEELISWLKRIWPLEEIELEKMVSKPLASEELKRKAE